MSRGHGRLEVGGEVRGHPPGSALGHLSATILFEFGHASPSICATICSSRQRSSARSAGARAAIAFLMATCNSLVRIGKMRLEHRAVIERGRRRACAAVPHCAIGEGTRRDPQLPTFTRRLLRETWLDGDADQRRLGVEASACD